MSKVETSLGVKLANEYVKTIALNADDILGVVGEVAKENYDKYADAYYIGTGIYEAMFNVKTEHEFEIANSLVKGFIGIDLYEMLTEIERKLEVNDYE